MRWWFLARVFSKYVVYLDICLHVCEDIAILNRGHLLWDRGSKSELAVVPNSH